MRNADPEFDGKGESQVVKSQWESRFKGAQYRERPFMGLLADAIELSLNSSQIVGNAMIRSSIMASTFALECAANCVLWHALRQKASRLFESLERQLSLLDKFEISMLNLQPDRQFDRGARPCQRAKDLVDRRNSFVHPKVKQHEMQPEFPIEPGIAIAPTATTSPRNGQARNAAIPEDSTEWELDDSRTAVSITVEFIDWFFIDQCKQTSQTAMRVLCNEVVFNDIDGKRNHSGILLDRRALTVFAAAQREWSISFRFIEPSTWDALSK